MGEPMRLPLSKEMLGRTLDGIGRPIDGLGDYFADEVRDVNGQPINPFRVNTRTTLFRQVFHQLTVLPHL